MFSFIFSGLPGKRKAYLMETDNVLFFKKDSYSFDSFDLIILLNISNTYSIAMTKESIFLFLIRKNLSSVFLSNILYPV